MDQNKLEEKILSVCHDAEGTKTLNCVQALKIADELNVIPIEVGKLCNQLGIKLKGCQLGCFK